VNENFVASTDKELNEGAHESTISTMTAVIRVDDHNKFKGIVETSHIADVLQYIDEDTWLLVDLDNTLFEAQQAFGHANWFYDEMKKKLQNGLSQEEAIRDIAPIWTRAQQICSVKPLEEDFIPTLISLQNRGIIIMGLTHRQPAVAEATIRQIASLGFDFLKTAPHKDSLVIPAKGPTLYVKGVLFVNDCHEKGDVFIPFLSMINQVPQKIVFVDDKRKNVEELEQTTSKHDIEYVGVYYTAIERVTPVYSRKIAEFQHKFLDKIMSNEAATLLLENGVE